MTPHLVKPVDTNFTCLVVEILANKEFSLSSPEFGGSSLSHL
jgi:hypothetical protein